MFLGAAAGLLVVATTALGGSSAETLTADDCVRLALEHSPSTRSAAAQEAAAEHRLRGARAAYYPRLSPQAAYGKSFGYDDVVTNGGVTMLGVRLDATLFDGGVRAAQVGAAEAKLQSAEALERQRRADVALAVRTAYFGALAARQESAIEADHEARVDSGLTLLTAQHEQGLVPLDDVLRARLAADSARTSRATADAVVAASLAELATLTGRTVAEDDLVPPDSMDDPGMESSIDDSPLMKEAEATVEAARRDADSLRGERSGRLDLTATGGFLGVDPGSTFRDFGGGDFLVGVTVPLFDGGVSAARVAAAVADIEAAEADRDALRQALGIALTRADLDAARAREEAESWRRAVPAASEAFQLARARYFGGGNVRLLELLDLLNQWTDTRHRLVRAELALRLAQAERDQILGRSPA